MPFVVILVVVLLFVLVATDPARVLFVVFLGYAISGPIITIRSVQRLKMADVVGDPEDDDDDAGDKPSAPAAATESAEPPKNAS